MVGRTAAALRRGAGPWGGWTRSAALLLYSFVRKEAVLSSQIEGTQSSLADLLLYEVDEQPGVPLEDARGRVFSYGRYVNELNAELEPRG